MTIKYRSPVFQVTRDTSHLHAWQKFVFWRIFRPFARFCFWLGIPVLVDKDGARLEILAIATSEPIASAIASASGENAFYVSQVPEDVSLPVTNVIFGGERAPMSETSTLHRTVGKRENPVICPFTRDLCRPHDSLSRSELAKALTEAKRLNNKLAVIS